MSNLPSIEEFRQILTLEYSSKGVKPPKPGGEKESELYKQWLKLKERGNK